MRLTQSLPAIILFTLISQRSPAAEDGKGLQALIDAAPAGGAVTIPKGEWTEPLRIARPVTLRGESRDECVLNVVSDDPAITLAHEKGEVVIENATIKWKRATSTNSPRPQAAIAAKDGAVRLRNLRVIAPDSYARCPSAFIAQGFCDAKIESCAFEGYEFTLQFGGGAKGSITDCLVSKSGHCGITAGPDSTVRVAGTIVTGSRYHGVRCTGGELTVENNLIIANKNRGIYLGNKSASGTVRNNVIQNNGSGISAFAESDVKVHSNLIAGSEFAAIDMRDGCRLHVDRNLLVSNGRAIVLFPESGNNRNVIGRNASSANRTESEGFPRPPELVKAEGALVEGEFVLASAKDYGPTDPERIKPVWQRWTALQNAPATQPAAAGDRPAAARND
jgi:hypothetical protein